MFIKQFSKNDCIPIQFMNALKYFYKDEFIPYEAIQAIYRNSFDIDNGTSLFGVEHIANLLNIYLKPKIDVNICKATGEFKQLLMNTLNCDGVVLLIRKFRSYHAILAYKVLNDKVTIFDCATKSEKQIYDIDKLLGKTILLIAFKRGSI